MKKIITARVFLANKREWLYKQDYSGGNGNAEEGTTESTL